MFGKRLTRALALTAATALLATAAVSAAELATAEVDGTANSVDVTAGGAAANFDIKLTASGSIDCNFTSAAPSTARVHTVYSLSYDGTSVTVSSNTLGSSYAFFSNGNPVGNSSNCGVTWTGAPTAYSQAASVTAAANVPAGSYTIDLKEANGNTETTNATGGAKLDDNTATTLTFVVSEPAGCDNTFEADFLRPFDGSHPESTLINNQVKNGRVAPVKVEIFEVDCATDERIGEIETGRVTYGIGTVKAAATNDQIEEYADAGASSGNTNVFRWSLDGFWIYNLNTKDLGLAVGQPYRIDIYVDLDPSDAIPGTKILDAFGMFTPTK